MRFPARPTRPTAMARFSGCIALVGTATTLAILSAEPGKALVVIDNTSAGTNQIRPETASPTALGGIPFQNFNNQNQFLKAFKFGNAASTYKLTNMRLALSTPASGNRTMQVDLYQAALSGGVYKPVGTSLGSMTQLFCTNAASCPGYVLGTNTAANPANRGQYFTVPVVGALANYVLQPFTPYALVYKVNSTSNISWRNIGPEGTTANPNPQTPYTTNLFQYLATSGSTNAGVTWATTVNSIGGWTLEADQTLVQTPVPALMGAGPLAGLFAFGSRLRKRIRSRAPLAA
jgi:hypothetical protein